MPLRPSRAMTMACASSLDQFEPRGVADRTAGHLRQVIDQRQLVFLAVDAEIVDVDDFDVGGGLAAGVALDEAELAGGDLLAREDAIEILDARGTDSQRISSWFCSVLKRTEALARVR